MAKQTRITQSGSEHSSKTFDIQKEGNACLPIHHHNPDGESARIPKTDVFLNQYVMRNGVAFHTSREVEVRARAGGSDREQRKATDKRRRGDRSSIHVLHSRAAGGGDGRRLGQVSALLVCSERSDRRGDAGRVHADVAM